MNASNFCGAVTLAMVLLACGGGEPPAAAPAAPTPSAEPAPPPAPSPETTATVATPSTPAPPVEKARFAPAPMKFVAAKGATIKSFELKADGSITSGGKVLAKVSPERIDDGAGKAVFTVQSDGAIKGPGEGTSKFVGDEFVSDDGPKVTIADDGAVSFLLAAPGAPAAAPTSLGKIDGAASAKKTAAAAVAAVFFISHATPASAPPAKAQPKTPKK